MKEDLHTQCGEPVKKITHNNWAYEKQEVTYTKKQNTSNMNSHKTSRVALGVSEG